MLGSGVVVFMRRFLGPLGFIGGGDTRIRFRLMDKLGLSAVGLFALCLVLSSLSKGGDLGAYSCVAKFWGCSFRRG